jgi:hypothetical protein
MDDAFPPLANGVASDYPDFDVVGGGMGMERVSQYNCE